ncbi:glutamate--tRNA ligase [Bacteroidia bacterium]|nr:glutamate--tRNA ligase [Bacteroidia bacterium]
MKKTVRVRFAPSPTGPLHIGGVRTALYNYLFARRHGGTMILRIEDTDSTRYVPGAEEYIFEALRWSGILIDEGVEQGGPHAPYRQSQRREIYLRYAKQLVASNNAYYAFDTPQQLETLRKECEARGESFAYNHAVREKMDNSLSLSPEQVSERIERGDGWVIRFRMPAAEQICMHDLIRGEVTVDSATLDDKVLYKSADNLPTYHLANIVDDHLMEISHVIRGEEWLPSLPLHYMLYKALGWSDTQPEFAHLPLILKPAGQGKLSKRDGDKMGFPVFPLLWQSPEGEVARGYREDGYLPAAFVNMLALLGWNPGTEQELFSMEELIEAFSLERVGKNGARFSPDKARWFNAQYIHHMDDTALGELLVPIVREHGFQVDIALASRIAALIKERATLLGDLWELCRYLFVAPEEYDRATREKYWKGDNPALIADLTVNVLERLESFSTPQIEDAIHHWLEEGGHNMGQVMNTLRLTITGANRSPSLYDICDILGRDETLARIRRALATLGEG